MLLPIIYLLLIKLNSISSLSGLYTDNGFDQTALHHEMTIDDQNSMKHDILELLGLPNRPTEQSKKLSLRKSAPQFLIDIYKQLSGDGTGSSRSKRSLTENEFEQKNVEESDVIMSFMNKRKKHQRSDLVFFDVSKISSEVFLMNSELRLYKNAGNQDFLLKIFLLNEKSRLREISSKNVTANHQGWIHLNVTDGLLKWMENSGENHGLFIKAQSSIENNLESYGIVTSKIEDEAHQPFIVAYIKGQEKVSLPKNRRSKRAAPKRTQLQVTNPFFPTIAQPAEKACSIQTLFVNFKDLKWHVSFHLFFLKTKWRFKI